MIDFKNGSVFKLKQIDASKAQNAVSVILVDNEQVVSAYQAIRDVVIFTNKRVIAINTQGITGKKKDFTSLPYSKIQAFSVETAGTLDLDSELELYYSGLGKVAFEFSGKCDITELGKIIANYVL